jgi:pyruvate dehydrogenase E2 component (dihydrolipoamide acetyltransferase)
MSSLPSDGSVTTDRVNAPLDTVELTVPGLGPAADRAVVVSWSKRIGERVAVDEPICRLAVGELEFEVHSTADGELTRILAEGGMGVLEHSALAQVAVEAGPGAAPGEADRADDASEAAGEGDEARSAHEKVISIEPEPIDPEFAPVAPAVEPPPARAEPEPPPADAIPPPEPAQSPPDPGPKPAPREAGQLPTGDDVDWSGWISPVVQTLADEHGIDLAEVTGTGIGGRIRKRDVLRHVASSGASGDA